MTNIIDLIASDSSSNEISDAIKDALYAKSSERIDSLKPSISSNMFDQHEIEDETTVEPEEETQEDG